MILARRRRCIIAGDLEGWRRIEAMGSHGEDDAALVLAAGGDVAGARLVMQGEPEKLRIRLESEPENAEVWRRLGVALAVLGRKEEALRAARRATELMPDKVDAIRGREMLLGLAAVQAWTGEHDAAFAGLRYLMGVPHTMRAGYSAHALRVDPRFAPLRDDPQFKALLNDPKNNAPLF